MATVDVAFAVNYSAIIRDNACTTAYPDLPNNYGTGYISGVVGWDNVNCGTTAYGYADSQSTNEGGAYLDVRVQNMDTIRLRVATLSAGFGCQCFIKAVAFYNGRSVSAAAPAHKFDPISYPTLGDDGTLATSQGHDDYWEINVTSQAAAQYRIQLSLVNSDARILGGFSSYLYISAPGKSRYSIN